MLNKLLKRCMPWMDKGRWYQIRLNTGTVYEVAACDKDLNVTITVNESSNHTLAIENRSGHALNVVDYKICASNFPGSSSITKLQEYFSLWDENDFSALALYSELNQEATIDLWFFMR